MPTYDEIIEASHKNVEALSLSLNSLDKLHDDIKRLNEKPEEFQELLRELFNKNKTYSNKLNEVSKIYVSNLKSLIERELSGFSEKVRKLETEVDRLLKTDFAKLFNTLQVDFMSQIQEDLAKEYKKINELIQNFSAEIELLKKEVNRLVSTDFESLFEQLQKTFIRQTKSDLAEEYKKIDRKAQDLGIRVESLQGEIDRLVKTDFNKLFNDLQKEFIKQTRSDLAKEYQNLDRKAQLFQKEIKSLEKEVTRLVSTDFESLFEQLQKTFIRQTKSDLAEEYKKIDRKAQLFQEKIKSLEKEVNRLSLVNLEKHFERHQSTLKEIKDQHEPLKKEVMVNRKILIVGIVLIAILTIIF